MAYSYKSFTVDSSTQTSKTFTIGFDYLRTTHISATVNSTASTDFTIDDAAGTLTFGASTSFDVGDTVVLIRDTPKEKSERVVDFADGSILAEADLDDSALQLLFITQEAFDEAEDTLKKDDGTSQWAATGLRITDLGTPTGGNDAVRKADLDAAVFQAGSLTSVSASDNDDGLFVNDGDWQKRTPAQSRAHLGLGTAAQKATGTADGDIPVLGASGFPAVAGTLITDVLANKLSCALVEWGTATVTAVTGTNWEDSTTRISTGATTFLNNAPASGAGTYFTARADNAGVDLAAGEYIALIPFRVFNTHTSVSGQLSATVASHDYDPGAGAGTHHKGVEDGAGVYFRLAVGTYVPYTYMPIVHISAATPTSIALFARDAGSGSLTIEGDSANNIKALIVRVGD